MRGHSGPADAFIALLDGSGVLCESMQEQPLPNRHRAVLLLEEINAPGFRINIAHRISLSNLIKAGRLGREN
jgi:hypothetical protein